MLLQHRSTVRSQFDVEFRSGIVHRKNNCDLYINFHHFKWKSFIPEMNYASVCGICLCVQFSGWNPKSLVLFYAIAFVETTKNTEFNTKYKFQRKKETNLKQESRWVSGNATSILCWPIFDYSTHFDLI